MRRAVWPSISSFTLARTVVFLHQSLAEMRRLIPKLATKQHQIGLAFLYRFIAGDLVDLTSSISQRLRGLGIENVPTPTGLSSSGAQYPPVQWTAVSGVGVSPGRLSEVSWRLAATDESGHLYSFRLLPPSLFLSAPQFQGLKCPD